MLAGLVSLKIIDSSDACKKAKPLAAPMAILSLISHESGTGLSTSATTPHQSFKQTYPS